MSQTAQAQAAHTMLAGADHEKSVALLSGPISDAAKKAGVSLLAMLQWLFQHPELFAKVYADFTSGGDPIAIAAKIVQDILDAWKAAQTTPKMATGDGGNCGP